MANTWINFTDAAFGWGTGQAGLSIIIYGALLAPVPRYLIGRLGESQAMTRGLELLCVAFTILALAGLGGPRWSWVVWPTIVLAACGMMFDSAMRSYITKLVPESEQGSLQGTLSALTLLCNVFAGFASNHVLGWLISSSAPVHWPGGHFVLASALFALASVHARRAMDLHSSASVSSVGPETPPRQAAKSYPKHSGSSDDEGAFFPLVAESSVAAVAPEEGKAVPRPSPARPVSDAP
jgi:DHA1 family tetracycline resistance protein-like MFS transporter